MSLFKKTIVLSDGGALGYVTVVRVGGSAGAKVVLSHQPPRGTFIALKIYNMSVLVSELSNTVTEMPIFGDFDDKAAMGAAVFFNGKPIAAGGKKELIDVREVEAKIMAAYKPKPQEQPAQTMPVTPAADYVEPAPTAVYDSAEEQVTAAETVAEHVAQINVELPQTDEQPAEMPRYEVKPKEEQPKESEKPKPRNFDFLKSKRPNYYASVQERVEEILRVYPEEAELNAIIPDSEWVMVHYDAREYYVFGVLREGGKVTHVGYGLPGVEGIAPPKEAAEIADFVPLPNQKGAGYWLMFQNAEDGSLIK